MKTDIDRWHQKVLQVAVVLAAVVAPFPTGAQVVVYALTSLLGLLALALWAVLAVRNVYGRPWPSSVFRGLAILAMDFLLSLAAVELAKTIVLSTMDPIP